MNVLGIETSCDETSVAVISDGELKSNLISSQDFHKKYGGVVPELSSRAHLQLVLPLIKQSLEESNFQLSDINVVAPTAGPGLIGALLVGLTIGKGIAYSLAKEFVPVNHIEGHIFSGFLMKEKPVYPFLCLVVSGGHTLLLIVESANKIRLLGSTIDDAAGEAFDKVSKMLGLGYPGGPMIQKYASNGDAEAINFPVAKLKDKYDYSFSGLKTAVLRHVQKNYKDVNEITENELNDITASFQKAVVDALMQNVQLALHEYDVKSISLVGGVAANSALRNEMKNISERNKKPMVIPEIQFCGDNAAMIANRGMMLFENGQRFNLSYNAFAALDKKIFVTSD